METVGRILEVAVDYAWGVPQLILLLGGGSILLIYSRFLPFSGIRHALQILRGFFDRDDDPGEITHFQALSTALASTVGMGNIGGVAIAITQGGPGALFWMWVAAVVGMATKFFTCTLSVMYRGKDNMGRLQGGPMYYIEVGLGRRFKPMAVFFSLCGMIGCLSIFQSNQIAEVLSSTYSVPKWMTGVGAIMIVSVVVLGGLTRIATVASKLVPAMCLLYLGFALYIAFANLHQVPTVFAQIFHDAFTGTAAAGGAAGIGVITVIRTGVKRAAFSNEAGIGTAPMAHGAARTKEPVREGLVAMFEPLVDTVMVCSLTGFIILAGGHWDQSGPVKGVALTTEVFEAAMGEWGRIALVMIVICFGVSTMFGYSYYGKKCFSYLFGADKGRIYDCFYIGTLYVGAVWSAGMVVNLIDTAFALMSVPNILAALALAPPVLAETRKYLARYRS